MNLYTITDLARGLPNIDLSLVQEVLENVTKSIDRTNIDSMYDIMVHTCTDKSIIHPEWSLFAGKIRMHQLKNGSGIGDSSRYIPKTFYQATIDISDALDKEYLEFVKKHHEILESMIEHDKDYNFDIFAIETLLKSYLYRYKHINKIVKDNIDTKNLHEYIRELDSIKVDIDDERVLKESPQYMYMRVAVFLHMYRNVSTYQNMYNGPEDPNIFKRIYETYTSLSCGYYTHASPTMFNAGFKRPQMSSCFLLHPDDNMVSITKSWKDSALISMNTGAIGIDLSRLRHSSIGNTGESHGIVPWAKIYNSIIPEVDQGGGKRRGSSTLFLQPWHKDIFEFIELKNPEGKDDMRARDMFYALWIPDEFMERVQKDMEWTLFCPHEAPGLVDVYGNDFKILYEKYEAMARDKKIPFKSVPARTVWRHILDSQVKTGGPFMLYGDACNRKSNQQNLGTITHSNLCVEIIEYTDKDNIASCNLASISLPQMIIKESDISSMSAGEILMLQDNIQNKTIVKFGKGYFNFYKLDRITRELIRNINNVIDRNYYPAEIPQIKATNDRNRPIGIGVQGLDDVFAMLDILWDSEDAAQLNRYIFEQMYYSAMDESKNLAIEYGYYSTFKGSPLSRGFFQFDLCELETYNKTHGTDYRPTDVEFNELKKQGIVTGSSNGRLDSLFDTLRVHVQKYGVRNSLLLSMMPTASTSSILGNNECIEPRTQNIYARTVLSGKFPIVNKHLVKDLQDIDMWNMDTITSIIKNNGSIHEVDFRGKGPVTIRGNYLKRKYRTVYEMSMNILLDMAADRGRYICQSQSLNCFMPSPIDYDKLTKYHFKAWRLGLKTGMYYLRTQLKTSAISVTMPKDIGKVAKRQDTGGDQPCLVCSS